MRTKAAKLAVIGFVAICALGLLFLSDRMVPEVSHGSASTGLGSVANLEANYQVWEAEYIKYGGDRNMVLPIGWFKGLSNEFNRARGVATLNIVDGTVSIVVQDLSLSDGWEAWLVDNGAGSVMPEAHDPMISLGGLERSGDEFRLDVELGASAFAGFEPDLVVVTRAGRTPVESRVMVGTTTLFHRLYRSGQRGEFGMVAGLELPGERRDRGFFGRLIQRLSPSAQAQIGPIPNPSTPLEQLITQGRDLFFNETFDGNGRTCGTCHRENNNLTIDPTFIATLPPNDPLFVAEFDPNLGPGPNGELFEQPVLMRKLGLIVENVDGLDDLANKFTMRGVPHTLALIETSLRSPGPPFPAEMTGWSADGAPGTGSLREFAIGAVIQHFTKTLNRTPGVDFRLPTAAELDAMEAFQRSLGRQSDLDLSTLSLKSETAQRGLEIFRDPGVIGQPSPGAGRCDVCHFNAGAGVAAGLNLNFDTGVENQMDRPQTLIPGAIVPRDAGFGTAPNPNGGFGDGTFNTPPVVEAADTGPFFHDNSVETIEAAVAFYAGPAFQASPSGQFLGGIQLDGSQITAVGAFMRVINALENIRSSIEIEERAKNAVSFSQAQELLLLSISELNDAIEVLRCGRLHHEAQVKLLQAAALDAAALVTSNKSIRNSLINQAIALKNAARNDMVH